MSIKVESFTDKMSVFNSMIFFPKVVEYGLFESKLPGMKLQLHP